jgi:lipid II:glycine glycyltransferase (peptidoglycan interpeptide bridge formation enzyme)
VIRTARTRNFYAVKFARPSYFADPTELMSSLGFEKRRMGTILIDLEQSPDVLWQRIDRIARRNISKIEPAVKIVEASKLVELQDFHHLHTQATKRLRIKTYPFSHFASLWKSFFNIGKIVAFTAFLKDRPIGASISLMHNGIVHEYAYADSDYARLNRIYAIDTLKWHIIKWAHDRNFKYFDLSGIEFYRIDAGTEKALNIYRYKSKWGGRIVEFHDYKKTFQVKNTKLLDLFLEEGEGCHT